MNSQKTYRILKEVLYGITDAQINLIQKWLNEMDDNEFRELPTILMTPDQKKIIETYGIIMTVMRKETEHSIYCILPSIFKIIN
jgi:hypothetical protein